MGLRSWLLQGLNVNVERNRNGQYSYWLKEDAFGGESDYMKWSLSNPVLQTVIALRCKLYSQMNITAVNDKGDDIGQIPELALLHKPNYFQSKQDFLFQQMWFLSAAGTDLIYQVRPFLNEAPRALFNLIPGGVDFKKTQKLKKFITTKADYSAFEKQTISYKLDGDTHNLTIGSLIPLYDLANGIEQDSWMQSPSRIKGIDGVLRNIDENVKSKNINLKMSQKYLGMNKTAPEGQPQIQPEDRDDIIAKLGANALSVTNANIEVQHLVKDLKNMSLDPMFEADAIKVMLAFDMNRDTLNYSGTGSKFDNNEAGIVNVIQNSIQGSADNLMNSLTNTWGLSEKGIKLKASFNHLPVMQTLLKSKIETFAAYQDALKIAIEAGTITAEEAKQMSDNLKKDLGL